MCFGGWDLVDYSIVGGKMEAGRWKMESRSRRKREERSKGVYSYTGFKRLSVFCCLLSVPIAIGIGCWLSKGGFYSYRF
jgi:hypothetical protein